MKRRFFLGSIASGAMLGLAGSRQSFAAESTPPESVTPLVTTPLVIMAPRVDGFEAVWAVTRLSKGRIEWESADGTNGQFGRDSFGFVPQGDKVLRVRAEGLKPGTRYRVRAVTTAADDSEEHVSPWKNVRTLDPAAQSTEFVVWNDTHVHDETIQQLHQATPGSDFLLWNGDTCNDWKSSDLLIPTLLHPGQRDISNERPIFLTWGNHDVRGPFAFEMPETVATPSGRPFYAFRSGPVAAICLHTGEDKPDSHPSFRGRTAFEQLRREQAEWLAQTIRRPELRNAPYRIVFCHIPLRWTDEKAPNYETGGFDHFSLRSRELWHDSLVDWKTQVVISGHTHRSALLPATEQFPYNQLVGGGPQKKSATWMHARANEKELSITVRDLEGAVKQEITLSPGA